MSLSRRYVCALQDGPRDQVINDAWQSLIRLRDPVTAVHQTQSYIDHLADMGNAPEILTVRDVATGSIAGVVPVRPSAFDLAFAVSGRTLTRLRLRSLVLMGSEPMVVDDPRALDALFAYIWENYPRTELIETYSVKLEGPFWQYLTQSDTISQRYGIYVAGGFRENHSIVLPGSVEQYQAKLGRKRRYNFRRQERLLEEHLGARLELTAITREEDLPKLFDALVQLGVSTGPRSPMSQKAYRSAARHGLLRCFVLDCGGHTVGAMTGITSDTAYFIHDIYFDKLLARFSPGTTVWQAALRYLIQEAAFTTVGISHGSPAYRFHETNCIDQKGRVLLYRRTVANRLRFMTHAAFETTLNAAKAKLGNGLKPAPARADPPKVAEPVRD